MADGDVKRASALTAINARSRQDGALTEALDRIGARGSLPAYATPEDTPFRPDTPDRQVTAVRCVPATAALYAPFPADLDERLQQALASRGISQLFTHQAEAVAHAMAGRHVVVVTPTASGKTLCYNAPVLHAILRDPSSRALYLFPTKALAQDQLAELQTMCDVLSGTGLRGSGTGLCESVEKDLSPRDVSPTSFSSPAIGVFTYDGDTPQDARRTIRARAHIVLSNPDMLHSGILPHHPRWAKLFENLRYVVLDELHAYRGVFGSHLGNVLRRLRRICRHYGSDPVFICSSATIANPKELAERLTEQPFELVDRSGAPRGEKFFVFVNPPVVNRQLGIRRSYLSETRRVASEFLKRNLQIIVFAQSRLSTEILTTYLKDDFKGWHGGRAVSGADPSPAIRGYRGGYLPLRRREIEKGLREGAVRAVVSTNALELGIDIGALDVCVMAGYPGTIAATWQRAGRAGRRSGRSAAILVASSAPIDQFVVRNPAFFFDASPERALIDPDNLHILVDHIKCAAFELPFDGREQFGKHDLQEILGILAEQGLVHPTPGRPGTCGPDDDGAVQWTWTSESYPADAVSLRSVSSDNFVVVDTTDDTRVIGETDFTSGPATLHPKAIYIVEGQLFQVERLDFEGRKAFVRAIDCDYYTTAITYTKVTVLDTFAESAEDGRGSPRAYGSACGPSEAPEGRPAEPGRRASASGGGAPRAYGEVHVVSRVVGFKKIKFYTNENVGSGELDLPEQQMHTTSYWVTVPAAVTAALPYAADDRRDGIVALAFAMKQVAQLLLMCDGHDVGLSIDSPADGEHKIFIYDNYPGGIGFSEPLFRMHGELLTATRRLIAECECENGCPGCVGPVGNTGPLAKPAALRILDLLLAELPQSVDAIAGEVEPL
jgi:DEAD/DEAH box helicase domain-containing protein